MELLRRTVELDVADTKRHLTFDFDVPAGTAALEVVWAFQPWQVGSLKNHLTLSLHGPAGFRGAGHRHGQEHRVTLGSAQATPGYLPGPLLPGRWTVTIHTHAVLDAVRGELCVMTAEESGLTKVEAGETAPSTPQPDFPWMAGDLHCHSTHSDARWTASELARAAVQRGLDFLALTDHNTISGRAELAHTFPGLLLPGLELTTFYGHALLLGRDAYTDWTALEPQQGMKDLLDGLQPTAAYLTIAHPFAPSDPICTGCGWTYFDLRPENATHLEVWNGPWAGRHNERALAYWYRLLAAGQRLTATVGTDAHGPAYHPEHGFTCTPRTSDAGQLLEQLKGGETYLSRAAVFDLRVRAQGREVRLGAQAPAGWWDVELAWHDLPAGCTLTLVQDGSRLSEALAATGQLARSLDIQRWLNLEVRLPDGSLFMLSNPVYARADSGAALLDAFPGMA